MRMLSRYVIHRPGRHIERVFKHGQKLVIIPITVDNKNKDDTQTYYYREDTELDNMQDVLSPYR